MNEDAARIAREGGMSVVMDRCTLREHQEMTQRENIQLAQ
ncbi:MAG: hypothetical protein J6386_23950 [Candidatus Synoicihabitans palmerolidicus]|nr:hypothetical protein [Candidatus Synoicihabitans palmerolidicus]